MVEGSSSASVSSSCPSQWSLNGTENDVFIPDQSEIDRMYADGVAIWDTFIHTAKQASSGLWARHLLDPHLTLAAAPRFPDTIPLKPTIHGHPIWLVDRIDTDTYPRYTHELTRIHGLQVTFALRRSTPIFCNFSSNSVTSLLGHGPRVRHSLGILSLAWAYIFSTRLLEAQDASVKYLGPRIHPQVSIQEGEGPCLSLHGASPNLVSWLSVILCSSQGWSGPGKNFFPPWACTLGSQIRIVAAPYEPTFKHTPPNSTQATELLIEFCQLFNLGSDDKNPESSESALPPYKAGFFAAMLLPFGDYRDLKPAFPYPHLAENYKSQERPTSTWNDDDASVIRDLLSHLPYFMPLSMQPLMVGSTLWSIFWHPDVNCQLVSPWLTAVKNVLEPILEARDFELLLKVFGLRRPNVSFWWHCLFLLGDPSPVEWIRRYTETLLEKWGFPSLSAPQPVMAAWTGSPQSFLDVFDPHDACKGGSQVSRATLIRRRYDFNLQDSSVFPIAWKPFGCVEKGNIEIELWPYLEGCQERKYHTFNWCLSDYDVYPAQSFQDGQLSHRPQQIPDNFGWHTQESPIHSAPRIPLEPSKSASLHMLSLLGEDSIGSFQWSNTGLPDEYKNHPWVQYWIGLDVLGYDEKIAAKPSTEPTHQPSWLLLKWLEGRLD